MTFITSYDGSPDGASPTVTGYVNAERDSECSRIVEAKARLFCGASFVRMSASGGAIQVWRECEGTSRPRPKGEDEAGGFHVLTRYPQGYTLRTWGSAGIHS